MEKQKQQLQLARTTKKKKNIKLTETVEFCTV